MIEKKRFNMIEQQIRTWDVLDELILATLKEMPRENYVAKEFQQLAFSDTEIPIGHEQTMLQPKQEARIVQSLALHKSDKVLHVGTGSGYVTALLAKLAATVHTIDVYPEFIEQAQLLHNRDKLHNVTYETGNGLLGSLEKAPFDVIIFSGSVKKEPLGLREQLAINGRLFFVEGERPMMVAKIIKRTNEMQYETTNLFDCVIPSLKYDVAPSCFVF